MIYSLYNRKRLIELLQYYFFLHETYGLLLENYKNENILIKEFLDSLNNHRYWQLRKIIIYVKIIYIET